MRPGDIIIIALLALASAGSFVFLRSEPGRSVEIYADGVLQGSFPLQSGRRISIDGPLGVTVAEIDQGRVRIVSSPCPNHLCMRMGSISRGGSTIVCVPNRIMLRIPARGSDLQIDAVTE